MAVTLMLFVRLHKALTSACVKQDLKETGSTAKILMNVTWTTMAVVSMSATTYQAITAALVMMASIWHTTDITV